MQERAEDPAWAGFRKQLGRRDRDHGRVVAAFGVKVPDAVLVEVHRDHDPEEAADGRHDSIDPAASGRSARRLEEQLERSRKWAIALSVWELLKNATEEDEDEEPPAS
jgi:hypothetical protein